MISVRVSHAASATPPPGRLAPDHPTELQTLLLRALTSPTEQAVAAWKQWAADVGVDDLEPDSQWLLPMLFLRLRDADVGAATIERYANVFRHNWYKAHLRLRALRPVLDELRRSGHEPVLLGGAALALADYPVLGARPFESFTLAVKGNLTSDQISSAEHRLTADIGAALHLRTTHEPTATREVSVGGLTVTVADAADSLVHVFADAVSEPSGNDVSTLLWAVDAVTVGRTLDPNGWAMVWRIAAEQDLTANGRSGPRVAGCRRPDRRSVTRGMNIIVAVMDRPGFAANTDVLVLVEPSAERLTWIPRDLWCPALHDRVNVAYRNGGPDLLLAALAEHDLVADHCLCLSRTATETALASVRVMVPVPVRMEFEYPLTPTAPIEEGSKPVTFTPPVEVLQGERVHQWIGARGGSDLHRLARQAVLLRRLLERGFDFSAAVADPSSFAVSDPAVLADLGRVRSSWTMETLGGLVPETIDGKQVLVRR